MLRLLNKRGQNTAEYAILIGVIVAAAIAMQVYVRRGMSARVKDAVDYSIRNEETSSIFNTSQYTPYYMDKSIRTVQDTTSSEAMTEGGGIQRYIGNEYMTSTGRTIYGNWTSENIIE